MYDGNMADREVRVKGFSYTAESLDALEASFSRERLRIYLDAVRGDRERALRLHAWNTAVSAAFYEPLQWLEVTLRNAMHRELAERYGPAWYDAPDAGLDGGALDRIAGARSELTRAGYRIEGSRIVAALSLGFWVSLTGRGGRLASGRKANYEMTLWRPALRRAFPHCEKLTRKRAHSPLNDLRALRNRIAHHEPIFTRDLAKDHKLVLDVAGWISPTTATWIEHHSRVSDLLTPPSDTREIGF